MVNDKSLRGFGRAVGVCGQWAGVETGQSFVGRDPIDSAARFQKVIDLAARQALLSSVVNKLVAIKPRETFRGAKPKKAARVLHDTIDVIAGQAVGCSVGCDRQALGVKAKNAGAN